MRVLFLSLLAVFSLSVLPADRPILFLGDSITQGWALQPHERFPERFEKDGLFIVNAGVGGNYTDGGLHRLPALLETHKPKVTVIMFGTNDSGPLSTGGLCVPVDRYRTNLLEMISLCHKSGSKVILCTPIPSIIDWRNKGMKPYVETVRQICAKKPRVQLVDTYQVYCEILQETIKLRDLFPEYEPDGTGGQFLNLFHPTAYGAGVIYDAIKPVLLKTTK